MKQWLEEWGVKVVGVLLAAAALSLFWWAWGLEGRISAMESHREAHRTYERIHSLHWQLLILGHEDRNALRLEAGLSPESWVEHKAKAQGAMDP